MVARRRLGPDGPTLSQISYGMMRFGAIPADTDPADHLCYLHDLGIDTHHSSGEYDTYDAYLAALAKARAGGRSFLHVVKVAEPSFDDDRFDGARLTKLVDRRLRELGADTIHSLQWLFRTPDPQDSAKRCSLVAEQADEILEWAAAQHRAGKILNLSVFPYSLEFAQSVLDATISTTFTVYLNVAELEYLSLLDTAESVLAIRPLAGGRLSTDQSTIDDALRFPLLHPRVVSSVLSVNSSGHADVAVAAAGSVDADLDAFERATKRAIRPTG